MRTVIDFLFGLKKKNKKHIHVEPQIFNNNNYLCTMALFNAFY